MKTHRLIPPLGLIAVFLISACAPAVPSPTPAPTAEVTITSASTPTPFAVQPEATVAATEVPPQAVATSRGPNLEATDPTTVTLASGQLQLVEFFRFT